MTFNYSKKATPYVTSKLTADQRFNKIDQLLRVYGITKSQWTKDWDRDLIELRFIIEEEGGKGIGIKMIAPLFIAGHRQWNEKTGKSQVIQAKNWAQSLALFENYLKNKLAAIAFGLSDVREEFLPNILVKDEDGQERTIIEVIEPALEASGYKYPQLAPPKQEREKYD